MQKNGMKSAKRANKPCIGRNVKDYTKKRAVKLKKAERITLREQKGQKERDK